MIIVDTFVNSTNVTGRLMEMLGGHSSKLRTALYEGGRGKHANTISLCKIERT